MANGVNAQEGISHWGIFPTLATDFVQINNQGESAEMQMLDANGKVIFTEKITSNSQKVIDLMNVPSGVYWVQRIQNGKLETRKMVKM